MGFQSRQPYWTLRRQRRFWRTYGRLSGQARAGLLGDETVPPNGAPTPQEQVSTPIGCCWNCLRPHHGLFACMYCGAEQPIGTWKFPPIVWPGFDLDDECVAFGIVGFIYAGHWLNFEFVVAEPDAQKRREIGQIVQDPRTKRRVNANLHGQAVQELLRHWRERFGHAVS